MWGVACSMAETQGLRKLSVAETLAQATSALEAHRVWMRRRMSTAVAPSSGSQMEEDADRDPAQDHNLGAKHPWEDAAGDSTAGNTESDFLERESPSELSKPGSAPPPSAQQWLETLKRRRIASNKIAPIAETGSTNGVESQQSFDRLRDVWKGHQSPRGEETKFDHTPLDGVQVVPGPTRGKLKRKRRSKARIVPSEDVSSTPPIAKRLTSTSDVFISPTPYHAEPVVTLNAWGSVLILDKRSDSAADVHQSSDSDEELSPELSTTTEDDLFHQDEAISNGAEISESPDNVSVSTSQHPQRLKAASTGRIIPVNPAPRDQRSSYDFQKQSKLSAADAAGEILDITASEMARTGSDLPGVRLSSARQRAVADVQDLPETKLQSVLPNAKGTRNSVFLSHPASQHNEDTDANRMDVEFKGKSSKSLSEIQSDADASLLDSSQPRKQQDLSIQKPVFEEATIPSSTEVNVAPSAKNTVKKNTRDSLLESRRDVMKELDRSPLKPLRLEEVIGSSDVLRRLPPVTPQSPQSPPDVSLSRKRRREPPSYSIHQPQLQASVLAPPCPAFGVEQPTETEVLRSLSKKQAVSTPGSESTPNITAMTPPASAAGSTEQTSALSRSALLRPLSAVKSVFSGAMFNRTETTKTDVAADGSFRTQSTLVAQDCQDIEQLEEEEEEEGGTAEGPSSYSQPAVLQTGAAEASLVVDAISMCELPPGPGPLHMAAKAGNLRLVQTLLRQGHDVDTPDHEGRTPLMYCIHSLGVHLSCADALIKEGANLNKQSSDGSTAMHLAASVGAVSLIELMILNGASAKIRDFDGRLPLHWATTPKTTKSIALLMKHYSVDVNTTDDAGMTPLMWAAYNSNLTVTAYLLEQGADCEEKDKDGYTAMHWAIHKDSTLCLQLLLKPDMTYFKDSRGRTVMHMAAELGAMAACDVILKLRLDALHDTDKKDRTPLHYAAACSRVDVCALLLDRGADATQKDSAHKTALDYARSKKLDYVVALLTCHGTAVADFARASKSTSVSSFLSHAVSFTALAEDTSREERSDTTSHRSMLSGRSSRVAPVAEGGGDTASVLSWSQSLSTGLLGGEEDISIYGDLDGDESFDGLVTSGGLLGRFTTDKHDPVQHFYFWLKPKTNSICWAREHHRKFAKEAKVLEIHEGPSNTVKLSPIYSPSDLHRYVFWVATAVGVLDLFAYNQEAYLNWIKAINKLAQRNTEDESNLKESLSRSRPASRYTLRSTNSVAPMNKSRPESPELPRHTSPVSNGSTAASDPVAGAAATSGHSTGHQRGKSAVGMFITSTPIPTAATSALHTSSAVGDTSPTRIPQMPVQFLDDVI